MDPSIFQSKFYKRILSKDSITILSAADDGVSFGHQTANGSQLDAFPGTINVFTEQLNLHTPPTSDSAALSSQSATAVNLCTSELSVVGQSRALVSVRGPPGVPNDEGNADRRAATDGSDGKRLRLFISRVSECSTRLALDANGGGGATTSDLATPAGTGGAGGSIDVVGLSPFVMLYENLVAFQQSTVLPEDWTPEERAAGKPLSRDDEMLVQAQGLVELAWRICPEADPVGAAVLKKLQILLPEVAKVTIFDVAAAVRGATYIIEKSMTDEGLRLQKSCLVSGGKGGAATLTPLARGINGKDGVAGIANVDLVCSVRDLHPSFPIAHPVQCMMLLDKARAYFYFGNKESLILAQEYLEAALIKTGFFAALQGEELETQINLLEAQKTALGLESGRKALESFQAIDKLGRSLLFQLTNTSLDYYCRRSNWVPRRAVLTLESEAHKALQDLKRIEKLYIAYARAVDERKQEATQRQDVMQEVETSQGMIDTHVQEMRDVLTSLRRSIKNPQVNHDIERMTAEVKPLLENLSHEIFTTFKLTPTQLCDAVKAIAAEPSKATAAKEVGKLAWQGLTKVPNVDGVLVEKDLLFGKLESITGNLRDNLPKLMEGAKISKEGFLVGDDAASALVVANTQQIEDLLKEFGKDGFGGKAELAAAKLRQYVQVVSDRNANIVQYNVVLKELIDSRAKKAALEQRRVSAQGEVLKSQDIDQIASMAELTADIHNYCRERSMRLLTLYRRAIFFSTLSDPDLLTIGGLRNDAALNLAASKLEDIKNKLHNRLEELREMKGSDAPPYPADYENAPGKFINLTSHQLKELLQYGRLRVTLPPVRKGSKMYPDFNGRADVRVYRARFWLDGIVVRDKSTWTEAELMGDEIPVSIGLKHCGNSEFTDVHDQPVAFSHDEINVNWQYRIYHSTASASTPAVQIPKSQAVDSGDVVNYSAASKDTNDAYAAPSPFATWVISLEDLDPRIDYSKVTRGRFEFFGTSRAFAL